MTKLDDNRFSSMLVISDKKSLRNSKLTPYILGAIVVAGLGLSIFGYFANKNEQLQTSTDATAPESSVAAMGKYQQQAPLNVATTKQSSYLPVANPKIILRLHGSNIEGIKLAPALATGYLQQLGAIETAIVTTEDRAEEYIQGYLPDTQEAVAVEIFAHGSGTSFPDMATLRTDIAMSSRPIKTQELEDLKLVFGDLASQKNEIVVALDGLAIIVHKSNPIESLTIKQIAELLSGDITDWSQVGGNAGPVYIHARDEISGAYDTINRLVLKPHNKQLSDSAKRYESVAQLADAVASDWYGIGFVGLPFAQRAKPIAVADDIEIVPLLPTLFNVATEDYPLMRRLYFYVPEQSLNPPYVRGMADFALSEAGQAIVKKEGFVSHSVYSTKITITQAMPKEYQSLIQSAERLSLNFRFNFGSSELDSKAKHDLERLEGYMKQHTDKKLMLFGFTDSVGSIDFNLQLSERRAQVVKDALAAHNIRPLVVKGFGKALPVATNDTDEGRHHNRRVEVWIQQTP